jgi:uncharacterized membrane protein
MGDQGPMPPHHHFHHGGYYYGGGHEMVFFSLLNTLFWLAVIALAIWLLYRWLRPHVQPAIRPVAWGRFVNMAADAPSAMEILRRRYAAGEIDAITFEHMRERLRASYAEDDEDYDGYAEGRDGPPLYE